MRPLTLMLFEDESNQSNLGGFLVALEWISLESFELAEFGAGIQYQKGDFQ